MAKGELIPPAPPGHKSGFVNIIGRPNVGKSTLMNALVGERMSIITHKPQTTRHRILGILSSDDFQIVFSDTPGIIREPAYKMQEAMNAFIRLTFEDADLMLFVTDVKEDYEADDPVIEQLRQLEAPLFLVINKTDLATPEQIQAISRRWNDLIDFDETVLVSALHHTNTDRLLQLILDYLPVGPAYYPKDQLTDRPERFFVSEIIREKILELYHQEIPYYAEVVVTDFEETETAGGEDLVRIHAEIYVGRKTQKSILIGKGGSAIKKLGTEARKGIEAFLGKKVFLELHVKVKKDWRDSDYLLRQFGYKG
jgi:GTP-binding protein Era